MYDCESIEDCLNENATHNEVFCDGGYIYDKSNYHETVITEVRRLVDLNYPEWWCHDFIQIGKMLK